ncbi:3763_t:CDS:1, partial [Acaulospora morrowiae]
MAERIHPVNFNSSDAKSKLVLRMKFSKTEAKKFGNNLQDKILSKVKTVKSTKELV